MKRNTHYHLDLLKTSDKDSKYLCRCNIFVPKRCSRIEIFWQTDQNKINLLTVVRLENNLSAIDPEAKKLPVVIFLPLFTKGSIRRITMSSPTLMLGTNVILPQVSKTVEQIFRFDIYAKAKFYINFLGLFAMYCVNLLLAFVGKSCFVTAMFSPGL